MRYSPLRGRHRQPGFTLLEVMIALAVLAVAAAGLISSVSQNIRQSGALEERTVALWLAQNQITELQVRHEFPEAGRRTEKVEMAGREWELTLETTETSHPGLRRVEVGVAAARDDFRRERSSIVTVTAFLGAPAEAAQ